MISVILYLLLDMKKVMEADDTFITLVSNYIFTLLGKIFFKLKSTDILYTFVMLELYAKELD